MHRIGFKNYIHIILGIITSFSFLAYGGNLTSVTVTPTNPVAGQKSSYRISFGTGGELGISELPADGKIVISFPADPAFDLSNDMFAAKIAVLTGGFNTPQIQGNSIILQRDGLGNHISANTAGIQIGVSEIGNPANPYANVVVNVETRQSDDTPIDNSNSNPFAIYGPIKQFDFIEPGSQIVGQAFMLQVFNAFDVNNNPF